MKNKTWLVFLIILFTAGMAKAEPPTAPFGGTLNSPLIIRTAPADSVTAHNNADDFVIENSGKAGMSILTADGENSNIYLGSPSNNLGAFLRWNYVDNVFRIGTTKSDAHIRIFTTSEVEAVRISKTGQTNFVGGVITEKYTVTTDNTNDAITYTAAQLMGKLIRRGTGDEITVNRVDVTDTAANIVAQMFGCTVGGGFIVRIINEDSTNTIQVDGGVGVTMSPNDPSTAIPANSTGTFQVVATNCTAASEAVTIHALGFATH